MSIINTGIFNSGSAYLRQLGNDWPTAQVITTSDVVESASNLYFTNSRVISALVGSNVSLNNLVVAGDLQVQGNTVTLNTSTLTVEDKNIVIAAGAVTHGEADGAGITIEGAYANIIYDGIIDRFEINKPVYVDGSITSTSNLVANGLIIRNINVQDSALTGTTSANTVVAESVTSNIWVNLYTANVVETSANLYFTTSRARSAFTAGKGIAITANGVISSKGDDTGLGIFNAGINLANALILSNNFANLVTFNPADGAKHLVYSLHLSNFSDQTAYVTGRYVSGANTILFANLFEMPATSFIEYQVKPQLYDNGDQLQFISYSSPTQPANSLVSAFISWQGSADTNFFRVANVINHNNRANIFYDPVRSVIFEGMKIVNPNPTDIPVNVWIANSNLDLVAYLAANVIVPGGSSIELFEYPKAIPADYHIRVSKNSSIVNNPISLFLSGKYTTQYTITPSTLTVAEGDNMYFNIDTLNIGDGSLLYYTLQGNVTQSDFVTPITGSVTISNSRGEIELVLSGPPDITDSNDFVLQLRKSSTSGTIVATSDRVYVLDTANSAGISVVESSSTVIEGSTITFTLTTLGVPDQTIYYSANSTGPELFVEGNTGSFALVNDTGNFTLTSNSSRLAFAETANFTIDFRTDNAGNGKIFARSNTVQLQDTAYGGTSAPSVRMLMVAGGGGGGFTPVGPPPTYYNTFGGAGGGGGAGGLLEIWNVPISTNTYNITIGGGGADSASGSNTIVEYGTGQIYTLVGGGMGEPGNKPQNSPINSPPPAQITGSNGGSGGGGAGGVHQNGTFTNFGLGYTGQGYNGSVGQPAGTTIPFGRHPAGGGGGAGMVGRPSTRGIAPTGRQGQGGSGGDGKATS